MRHAVMTPRFEMVGGRLTRALPNLIQLRMSMLSKPESKRFARNRFVQIISPKELSGMFRRGASLAIPQRKGFATIPSVSLVHLAFVSQGLCF